ncbi:MAG TPA: DUF951 domain-containing protein [Clostridiales bacterium]|nr:DUF951 domain-containing protein [Clostridiales bacterium]
MDLKLHTRVKMRKAHPCGNDLFVITRVGMDIKLRCLQCGREIMLPRKKAEKAIKQILPEDEADV